MVLTTAAVPGCLCPTQVSFLACMRQASASNSSDSVFDPAGHLVCGGLTEVETVLRGAPASRHAQPGWFFFGDDDRSQQVVRVIYIPIPYSYEV